MGTKQVIGRKDRIYFIIVAMSSAIVLLHLFTNAFASYGIFRDEFYYLACANHLDIGYVDQPPLSIWLLAGFRILFGDSLFAIRFIPAVCSGTTVFIAGCITKKLGGNARAVFLACLATMVSLVNLAFATIYSMNAIDLVLWPLALYLVILLILDEKPILWIYIGVILGLCLMNKIGALFLGAGFFVALLLTKERKWFATPWPYLCGLIDLAMFSPYIIWNFQHDWAHLEFIKNASAGKYSGLSPISFLSGQLLINNPMTIPLWIGGIIYVFYQRRNMAYRFIFIIFLVVVLILIVNGTSKPEYLAPIFMVLFIGGGLMFEYLGRRSPWIFYGFSIILLLGMLFIPSALPILPVQKYIAYSSILGVKPSNSESKALGDLPQFYADMFGWEAKVAAIADAYHALSPEQQKTCAIFGDNYGRCGAVDYYAKKYNLPYSIGNHNNYWLWGPGKNNINQILILGHEIGDKTELFDKVEDLGIVTCRYCMPYEDKLHLFLCTHLKKPINEMWPRIKNYN